MKKLLKKLKILRNSIWFRLFPKSAIKRIDNKLAKAVVDKEKKKIILMYEIRQYLFVDLKISKESKYIPLKIRQQACNKVHKKFGKRMRFHKIKMLLDNLKLVNA